VIDHVTIVSEKGGTTKLKLPFKTMVTASKKDIILKNNGDGYVELTCKAGGEIVLKNGYE